MSPLSLGQAEKHMGHDQVRGEFERFVATSSERLLRTAYLVVRDGALAEDLVQECLFRVARRWYRVRSMEHPYAYARQDPGQPDPRRGQGPDAPQFGAGRRRVAVKTVTTRRPARALAEVDAAAELVDALGRLAPRQRAALVLRYFEDLSEAQTAEAMGCSVGTVKSTTSRALERLRQVLASNDTTFDPQCTTTT